MGNPLGGVGGEGLGALALCAGADGKWSVREQSRNEPDRQVEVGEGVGLTLDIYPGEEQPADGWLTAAIYTSSPPGPRIWPSWSRTDPKPVWSQ